ncbi:FtsX-like permease family protein [Streptomyces sp. SID3343]|uniref:ABC transporter permease n=1 Tax=Streptomyces sp. SID3343 TaxID=2690260 RepID=UPI00136A2F66|nr:FtsX-like permease family protein [Streptomyces sp. SID3343]MYV99199.1 FtsX-like permease family protein [Streptomyces sp. SID3343]
MLIRLSLANLWARKRRLVGLVLAVLLGTAFLSGALVLADTMSSSIGGLIRDSGAGTDVVVRNATDVADDPGSQRGGIDASLVDRVRAVPGVANAEPIVQGYGQVVGKDGKALTGNGPRVAGNWVPDPALTPYRLADGRAPTTADEVVIDRATAKQGHLKGGDRITVLTPGPVSATVVGIATFGDQDAFGGGSFTAFDLDGARQHVLRDPGRISTIAVRAADGTDQRELATRIQQALPAGTQALPGAQATGEAVDAVEDGFLSIFRTFLTVFAAIALVVAAFSINHTFSVVAAQRTREVALMRALGAGRGQVLRQALIEALVIGVLASAIGLAMGLGLAAGLKELFAGLGFELPTRGLTFKASTAYTVLPVGILVTAFAALVPAVRGSRVAPITALRGSGAEAVVLPRRRLVTGAVLLAAGIAIGVVGGGMIGMAIAAATVLSGVLLVAPAAIRALGGPLTAPLARLRGAPGALARGNLLRSPRRTAGAATAMVLGIAVVTVFSVFAASLKEGSGEQTRKVIAGQIVIGGSSPGGWAGGGHSPELTSRAAALPGVETATGIRSASALVDGHGKQLLAVESAHLDRLFDLDVTSGAVTALGANGIAISADAAKDEDLTLGSSTEITFPDGVKQAFTVTGLYDRTAVVGDYLIDRQAWEPHADTALDAAAVLRLRPGASTGTVKAAVERLAEEYGAPPVRDREGFVAARAEMLQTLVAVVYVLLALALVIALGGIANTLSLAAHERTRELGLLRAIGAARSQVRAALRWESTLTAVLGAGTGLVVGLFLGWVAIRAIGGGNTGAAALPFAVPVGQIAILITVGALGGLLAGARPAAKAAKLPVLRALATE